MKKLKRVRRAEGDEWADRESTKKGMRQWRECAKWNSSWNTSKKLIVSGAKHTLIIFFCCFFEINKFSGSFFFLFFLQFLERPKQNVDFLVIINLEYINEYLNIFIWKSTLQFLMMLSLQKKKKKMTTCRWCRWWWR